MWGSTSFVSRNRLRTFTRIDSSHISTVESSKVAWVGAIALFMSESTRPYSSMVRSTSASRSCSIPMSQRTAMARPPAPLISSTVASMVPGRSLGVPRAERAAQTTAAPASA